MLALLQPGAGRMATAAAEVLGAAPTYTERKLGPAPPKVLPGAEAITARIWMPGLDDGFVPQGLSFIDGAILVAAYRPETPEALAGPCRVWRVDPRTGKTGPSLDLPPGCRHAGGLARGGPGEFWVVDAKVLHLVALAAPGDATLGRVKRAVRLPAMVKGSFAAGDGQSLWIGAYEREGAGRLYRIALAALGAEAVDAARYERMGDLPSRAQGAAFDPRGRLWITRSAIGPDLGELVRLDARTGEIAERHAMPAGIEDISFAPDGRLWAVSEAGSRRWLSARTFFPVIFRIETERLR
jgi:hypothetical protein